MIDALPSEPGRDSETATRHLHVRLIFGAMAALVIVGVAFAWRITNGPPPVATPVAVAPPPAKSPVLEELVEATKALEVSQQQAIDQLQVLQQQLAAQQAETRKSSGEVAALGDKLETLRQSFASVAPPAEDAVAPQHEKAKPAIAHARRRAHRVASAHR